jgi:hypothetical protein
MRLIAKTIEDKRTAPEGEVLNALGGHPLRMSAILRVLQTISAFRPSEPEAECAAVAWPAVAAGAVAVAVVSVAGDVARSVACEPCSRLWYSADLPFPAARPGSAVPYPA